MLVTPHKRTEAMALVLLAGVVTISTNLPAAEGAFHDGIRGSSLRFGSLETNSQEQQRRWLKSPHHPHSRNLQNLVPGSTSAQDSCEAARAKEESDIAPGGGSSRCACEQSVLDERYNAFIDPEDQPVVYELTCVDERCSYCSPDGSTCDRFSYGALFEEIQVRDGSFTKQAVAQVGYFETNQYVVGRPEAVVYTEFHDPTLPGSHACSMEIDNLECAVCEYIDCGTPTGDPIDRYYGLNVVCSNILIGDGAGGMQPALDFETCDAAQLEGIGATQGVFQMYDPDYGQCYSSAEGCARDKAELEQGESPYYECECVEGDLPTDGASPFLENVQLQCWRREGVSGLNQLCGGVKEDSITRTYSSYVQETNTRTVRASDDGPTVTIEESGCQTTQGVASGCSECRAIVDGTECTRCSMEDCGDQSGHTAPMVDCGNAGLGTVIDLCRPDTALDTPLEAFACGFGEASKVPNLAPPTNNNGKGPDPVSMMACEEKLREFQARNNFIDRESLSCECLPIDENAVTDAGTLLECTTNGGGCGTLNGGSVCNEVYAENPDGGVCFREELYLGFLSDGSHTPMTRTSTYTHGTDSDPGNSLVGRTLVLTEYGNGSEGCSLLVDGEECNSCKLENCGDTLHLRPLVDCSNAVSNEADAQFLKLDSCEAYESFERGGILLRLTAGASTSGSDFRTCSSEAHDGFGSSGGNGDSGSSSTTDSSLPTTCSRAQPIVLPTVQDDPVRKTRDLTNPNTNFAFVSFVSSTQGLAASEEDLDSCGSEEEESQSPGLWYSLVGTGKAVHASVCREATNYEARISVYERTAGSCEDLACVAGSSGSGDADQASACSVHWVAQAGKTYHLRVHGSAADQAGTFNLFLESLSVDITDSCETDSETWEFDPACLACSKAKASRMLQSADPTEMDCRCLSNPGSGGYHLTCVDLSCLKCNPKQDTCGFETYELDIQKSGDSPRGSYESFYFMNQAEGTEASAIAAISSTECLEVQDPYQKCLLAKEETMSSSEGNNKVFCECRGVSNSGDYMLLCSVYDSYEYCAEGEVCADSVFFGQSISQYGAVTSEFRNYVVPLGGDDSEPLSITIERSPNVCVVSIDSQACTKCEIVECSNNDNNEEDDVLAIATTGMGVFMDVSVDCSNVVEGASSATFECGTAGGESNILSIFDGSASSNGDINDNAVPQTIPPNLFPPTSPPGQAPAIMVPTEPGSKNNSTDPNSDLVNPDDVKDLEPATNQTTKNDTQAGSSGERRRFAGMASIIAALASVYLLL